MKKEFRLLMLLLLAAGVIFGIGYGVGRGEARRPGPELGMMDTVEVIAPRADRVVEEIVVTAKGPILVLPVVEVKASRGPRQLAEQLLTGSTRVN